MKRSRKATAFDKEPQKRHHGKIYRKAGEVTELLSKAKKGNDELADYFPYGSPLRPLAFKANRALYLLLEDHKNLCKSLRKSAKKVVKRKGYVYCRAALQFLKFVSGSYVGFHNEIIGLDLGHGFNQDKIIHKAYYLMQYSLGMYHECRDVWTDIGRDPGDKKIPTKSAAKFLGLDLLEKSQIPKYNIMPPLSHIGYPPWTEGHQSLFTVFDDFDRKIRDELAKVKLLTQYSDYQNLVPKECHGRQHGKEKIKEIIEAAKVDEVQDLIPLFRCKATPMNCPVCQVWEHGRDKDGRWTPLQKENE